jgi:hypothetical protein
LGPLLWHWADAPADEVSIEVSLAEVLRVATLLGFKLMKQEMVPAAYIGRKGRGWGLAWLRQSLWGRAG